MLALCQVRLCFGKLVQCTPAALQQQFAFVGEVHAAGGAMEQAGAEFLFKAGDALADRRGGQAEHACGADDAAGLGGTNEGKQGGDGVHVVMIAEQ